MFWVPCYIIYTNIISRKSSIPSKIYACYNSQFDICLYSFHDYIYKIIENLEEQFIVSHLTNLGLKLVPSRITYYIFSNRLLRRVAMFQLVCRISTYFSKALLSFCSFSNQSKWNKQIEQIKESCIKHISKSLRNLMESWTYFYYYTKLLSDQKHDSLVWNNTSKYLSTTLVSIQMKILKTI